MSSSSKKDMARMLRGSPRTRSRTVSQGMFSVDAERLDLTGLISQGKWIRRGADRYGGSDARQRSGWNHRAARADDQLT